MCGLTLCVAPDGHSAQSDGQFQRLLTSLHDANDKRGPDASGLYATRVPCRGGHLLVTLGSSVLGLRGALTSQPLVGTHGVLAWNGQVFGGDAVEVAIDQNDTRQLYESLEAGMNPEELFASVEGPFAYVYFEFATSIIHFGLDPLSRRSLLVYNPTPTSDATTQSPCFFLTSARSAEARAQGLSMQRLDGGQTGMLDLSAITLSDGVPDYTAALRMWTRQPLQAVNTALPAEVSGTDAAAAELPRFVARLTDAVRRRVQNIAPPPPGSARVAVLFSGGVDCSLLTALIHRVLPAGEPIDLINVAFEQPSPKGKAAKAVTEKTYNVPDRMSGLEAADELRAACPGREFRFVHVNINIETSRTHRQNVVDLMYPSNTEMDVSLAYPLYFGSRGQGMLQAADGRSVPYATSAKVYISGLGADEQLAGYTRHRRAFDRGSWSGLIEEIQLDLDRLPQRNLSRDDRILSSHARDARYPFLDLAFVNYVSSLPVWAKTNMHLPAGEGDKLLIRLAAKSCGLQLTGTRVKRAMQFGTKSAKLNEAGSKGHRVGEGLIQECL